MILRFCRPDESPPLFHSSASLEMLADYRLESPDGPPYSLEYEGGLPHACIRLFAYAGYRELLSLKDRSICGPTGDLVAIIHSRTIRRPGQPDIRLFHAHWGRLTHYPIYLGERQIGQIVMEPEIVDFMPQYHLYLLPEHDELGPPLILLLLLCARADGASDGEIKAPHRTVSGYAIPHAGRLGRYDPDWLDRHFPGTGHKPIRYPFWIGFASRYIVPLVGCLFCALFLIPAYVLLQVYAPSGEWRLLLVPLYAVLVYHMVIRPAIR